MTTMKKARQTHHDAFRIRQRGGGEDDDGRPSKWVKTSDYVPFRQWARSNQDEFDEPLSPKLAKIVQGGG